MPRDVRMKYTSAGVNSADLQIARATNDAMVQVPSELSHVDCPTVDSTGFCSMVPPVYPAVFRHFGMLLTSAIASDPGGLTRRAAVVLAVGCAAVILKSLGRCNEVRSAGHALGRGGSAFGRFGVWALIVDAPTHQPERSGLRPIVP